MTRTTRLWILGSTVAVMAIITAVMFSPANNRLWAEPQQQSQSLPMDSAKRLREPAVAGLFYPKDPVELAQKIDGYLAKATPEPVSNLKALISPHAGYEYSGPTAAFGYKLLIGRHYPTVIVLAPSHYAPFQGVSVCAADYFQTPLGLVEISGKAKALAGLSPFALEPHVLFQRPQWWTQSSRPVPPVGEETPETWEHSDEVQVPFLQKTLKGFKLLPAVFGAVDPEQAAIALAGQLDAGTLIVASSDLSHYHPYEEARQLDQRCVKAICEMDIETMKSQEACGKEPILTLMYLAKQKGWKPKLLDYRNSGDVTGDKSTGVVGYASIAFCAPGPEEKPVIDPNYSDAERKQLLALARQTLKEAANNQRLSKLDPSSFPAKFSEPKACFVTLTIHGRLRGCIGHIEPQMALYKAIQENARSATLHDPRFSPVEPEELDKIEVEVSVLTEPQPLAFSSPEDLLAKLQPHRDGVVLQMGNRRATYLPQVWEQLPDKETFLSTLAEKAGCEANQWRQPGTRVSIYHVEAFKESDR